MLASQFQKETPYTCKTCSWFRVSADQKGSCGKPSRSCHACRARKTKCDARPTGCSQCERVKRKCPGYRLGVDLIFRDQSDDVIRKAKAREASAQDRSPSRDQQADFCQQALRYFRSLSPTVEDRAKCYFISNYEVGIMMPGYGEPDDMTISHTWKIMDPTLAACVKATSLASYAHYVRDPELVNSSQLEYMKAIKMTNSALSCARDAIKDSTLLSINFLGLYELLTGLNPSSTKNWAEHVRGAATLLELRGPDQFETPFGRRIFLRATSNMLTICVQQCMRMPTRLIQMMESLSDTPTYTNQFSQLGAMIFQTVLEFNELRCDIKDNLISDPEAVIDKAMHLDKPLAGVCDEPPLGWQFDKFKELAIDRGIVFGFGGRYHVYSNALYTSWWNTVRVFRIMIHELIRDMLLKVFAASSLGSSREEQTKRFHMSTAICYNMQADILASVPHSLGYVVKTSPKDGVAGTEGPKAHRIAKTPSSLASSGYMLLWPLWYAGFMDLATEEVRVYCVKILRSIGDSMGIQQAFVVARLIETKTQPQIWARVDSELGEVPKVKLPPAQYKDMVRPVQEQ